MPMVFTDKSTTLLTTMDSGHRSRPTNLEPPTKTQLLSVSTQLLQSMFLPLHTLLHLIMPLLTMLDLTMPHLTISHTGYPNMPTTKLL
ncbi:unnamed protein product [Larinioides sclopetarius]|uniref:NADH dehydrogenase subunit 4 n=1 Tax=Larinioides sclopetarius TaxID=280406 RepID=A0AAV2A6J1_9ARAC